jgi:WhiB family redox-sensing transcriptional regulator
MSGRKCGIYASYIKGCRCDECRRAARNYQRDYQQRKRAQREAYRETFDLPSINEGDVSWHRHAACRNVGADTFFKAGGSGRRSDYSQALELCGTCRVRSACLDYAFAHNQQHGVWGGLTPTQRANIKRVAS